MRSRPPQPFTNKWAEMYFGKSSLDISLIYPRKDELSRDYSTLIEFRRTPSSLTGFKLRIEKTERTPWLELSCWSRSRIEEVNAPSLCFRLSKNARNRLKVIQHLQQFGGIELRFVCLEEEVGENNSKEMEAIDKTIERIRKGTIFYAAGTTPILLRQMRVFGQTYRAPYAES